MAESDRHPLRTTRPRSLLLACLALGGVASCTPRPDLTLQPVLRLVEHLEDPLAATPSRCSIADESRPALGCATRYGVLSRTIPFPEATLLEVRAPLPSEFEGKPILLRAAFQSRELEGWTEIPPIVIEKAGAAADLVLPLPASLERADQLRIRVTGQLVPEGTRTHRTRSLTVPRAASLRVGLALDPSAVDAGAGAALFRIVASGDFGRREILRETVAPGSQRPRWIDRRVDLTPLAGRAAHFEFQVGPVSEAATAWTHAVWGNPQILEPRPRAGQPNLVLVSLDTLRGDFVGARYEGRPLTPRLDARAREGASFRQALAPYPSTSASHTTLLTSTYPAQHKVLHAKYLLPASPPTLAEILAGHAFETAAFTENAMLTAESGFDRGFDDYFENRGLSMWDARGDVERTLDRGLAWIRRHRDTKFFLFLHTYQVHSPYQPPPKHDVFRSTPGPGEKPRFTRARDLYAGEVVYTDGILRRLFDTLERLGLDDDTIVVVTADHGDEFGEHGRIGHSRTVYDEVLRVPLIFWGPGRIPAGRVVDDQVSLVDIAPTLLELLELPAVDTLQGESLVPSLLRGAPVADPVRFAEGPALDHPDGRLFSARTSRYKWIGREHSVDPVEIYALETDPREQNDLSDDPELRARGRALLRRYRELDTAVPVDPRERPVDELTRDKLRALGYTD